MSRGLLIPRGASPGCRPHTPRPNVVAEILHERQRNRLRPLADDLSDETADAALAGNPKRAHYLEQHWAARVRDAADHAPSPALERAAYLAARRA